MPEGSRYFFAKGIRAVGKYADIYMSFKKTDWML